MDNNLYQRGGVQSLSVESDQIRCQIAVRSYSPPKATNSFMYIVMLETMHPLEQSTQQHRRTVIVRRFNLRSRKVEYHLLLPLCCHKKE